MGVWAGLKWVAREGTGAGVQQRLVWLILGRSRLRPSMRVGILQQFLDSASVAVSKFGPVWVKQEVGGQPLIGWLLVCCWMAVPILLAFVLV